MEQDVGPAAAQPSVSAAAGGIEALGVRRTFGDVVAVDHLDLVAAPGAVTALVGPNGSGKTTLMLVLATLLVPDAGQVRVAGFDPVRQPREVRRRLGWMPDVFGTWESLTCREVLDTVADAFRVPRSGRRERVAALLELVHLEELADRPTQVLSRGQKQRLGLARALVHDPQVVVLDEPASGLDPRSRIELRQVVRDLADTGRTVLVSSHVLAELDEMVDRAVIVSGGRTVSVQDLGPDSGPGLDGPGGALGPGRPVQARTWRVRALDQAALLAALDAGGTPHGPPERDGVPVQITGGDRQAADLITDLVGRGVRVVSCQPAGGVLEQAYLALTQERR